MQNSEGRRSQDVSPRITLTGDTMISRPLRAQTFAAAWFAPFGLMLCAIVLAWSPHAQASSGAELEKEARAALDLLYDKQPEARFMAEQSTAVLVFPRILKAGLVV